MYGAPHPPFAANSWHCCNVLGLPLTLSLAGAVWDVSFCDALILDDSVCVPDPLTCSSLMTLCLCLCVHSRPCRWRRGVQSAGLTSTSKCCKYVGRSVPRVGCSKGCVRSRSCMVYPSLPLPSRRSNLSCSPLLITTSIHLPPSHTALTSIGHTLVTCVIS